MDNLLDYCHENLRAHMRSSQASQLQGSFTIDELEKCF